MLYICYLYIILYRRGKKVNSLIARNKIYSLAARGGRNGAKYEEYMILYCVSFDIHYSVFQVFQVTTYNNTIKQ